MYFLLFLYLRGKETKERYQRKKRKHAIVSYALRAFTNAGKPALSASLVASLDARLLAESINIDEALILKASFLFLWVRFFLFGSQIKRKKCTMKIKFYSNCCLG